MDSNQTQSLEHHPPEVGRVREGIEALWDAAKRAGKIIADLRDERNILMKRVEALESEAAQLRRESTNKETSIRKLKEEVAKSEASSVQFNGNREALTSQVKELLAKIDAYL